MFFHLAQHESCYKVSVESRKDNMGVELGKELISFLQNRQSLPILVDFTLPVHFPIQHPLAFLCPSLSHLRANSFKSHILEKRIRPRVRG